MAQLVGHRNVLSLIGVVTRGTPMMLLCSYCEHGSLLAYMTNCPGLPEQDKIKMAVEITRGMDFLTGRRFVHRDLAARNVMMDSQLTCQVADFGLSRGTKGADAVGSEADQDYYRSENGVFPVR